MSSSVTAKILPRVSEIALISFRRFLVSIKIFFFQEKKNHKLKNSQRNIFLLPDISTSFSLAYLVDIDLLLFDIFDNLQNATSVITPLNVLRQLIVHLNKFSQFLIFSTQGFNQFFHEPTQLFDFFEFFFRLVLQNAIKLVQFWLFWLNYSICFFDYFWYSLGRSYVVLNQEIIEDIAKQNTATEKSNLDLSQKLLEGKSFENDDMSQKLAKEKPKEHNK